MKRYETLDMLRGIAAIGVILAHYTWGYKERYGHIISNTSYFTYNYLGVHCFFMISGFVIFLTLESSTSTADFAFKRFSRLYPIFWACMITTYVLIHIFGLPDREASSRDFAVNLTMLPAIFHAAPVDGAYWSLIPEVFFYLAMVIVSTFRNKNAYLGWGIVMITLTWINKFVYTFPVSLQAIFNLQWGSLFFSGILFYKLKKKEFTSPAILYIFLGLAMATAFISFKNNTERLIVLGFYLIFYLFSIGKLERIGWKPFLFIGKISFPLYLLHQNIGYIIMNYTKTYLHNYPLIFILIPMIVVIILGYLYHIYIEEPSIKMLRQIWRRYYPQKRSVVQ